MNRLSPWAKFSSPSRQIGKCDTQFGQAALSAAEENEMFDWRCSPFTSQIRQVLSSCVARLRDTGDISFADRQIIFHGILLHFTFFKSSVQRMENKSLFSSPMKRKDLLYPRRPQKRSERTIATSRQGRDRWRCRLSTRYSFDEISFSMRHNSIICTKQQEQQIRSIKQP